MLLTFHIHLYNKSVIDANFCTFWDKYKDKFTKYIVVKEYGREKECFHYQGYIDYPECKGTQDKYIKELRKALKDCIIDNYRKQDTAISKVKKDEDSILKYLFKDIKNLEDIIFRKGYKDEELIKYIGSYKKKDEVSDWRYNLLKYVEEHTSSFLYDREDIEAGHFDEIDCEWIPTRRTNCKILHREKLFDLIGEYYKGDIYDRDLVRRYDYVLFKYHKEAYLAEHKNRFCQYRSLTPLFISYNDIDGESTEEL